MKKLLLSMISLANCATIFGAAGPEEEVSIEDLNERIYRLEDWRKIQDKNYGLKRIEEELANIKTQIQQNTNVINRMRRSR